MATFPVVLDACVLFNAPVRDTLLRAAEIGLYRVHWSQRILDETTKNLVEKRNIAQERAERLAPEMSKAFPEAMVDVPEEQIRAMKNNEKDRHVAACAVCATAQVICTFNLKDFKAETLEEWNIEAQAPDEFACHLFDLAPEAMMSVLIEQAEDLRDMTLDRLLGILNRDLPQFVRRIEIRLRH